MALRHVRNRRFHLPGRAVDRLRRRPRARDHSGDRELPTARAKSAVHRRLRSHAAGPVRVRRRRASPPLQPALHRDVRLSAPTPCSLAARFEDCSGAAGRNGYAVRQCCRLPGASRCGYLRGPDHEQRDRVRHGRYIAVINTPMADGGWVGTHHDITERRQLEKERDEIRPRWKSAAPPSRRRSRRSGRRSAAC